MMSVRVLELFTVATTASAFSWRAKQVRVFSRTMPGDDALGKEAPQGYGAQEMMSSALERATSEITPHRSHLQDARTKASSCVYGQALSFEASLFHRKTALLTCRKTARCRATEPSLHFGFAEPSRRGLCNFLMIGSSLTTFLACLISGGLVASCRGPWRGASF